MNATEKKTLYFSKPGAQNTDKLLEFVKKYAKKEEIKDIVVASTTGKLERKPLKPSKATT
ncbi:MAG: hypothetical protein ACP5LB_00685 [Candidatus Bathyarchaeia archaeon]